MHSILGDPVPPLAGVGHVLAGMGRRSIGIVVGSLETRGYGQESVGIGNIGGVVIQQ